MRSETISKLAEALAKAQGEMHNAAKDKDNPFFKSTYADLASVWDACREALSKNGLCVVQPLHIEDSGRMILTTTLLHASGEWISSVLPILTAKNDPQSVGSSITYMRRFALSSLVGIAPAEKPSEADVDEDDDGNAASDRKESPPADRKPTEPQLTRLWAMASRAKVSHAKVHEYVLHEFKKASTAELTIPEYDKVCKKLDFEIHLLSQKPPVAQQSRPVSESASIS